MSRSRSLSDSPRRSENNSDKEKEDKKSPRRSTSSDRDRSSKKKRSRSRSSERDRSGSRSRSRSRDRYPSSERRYSRRQRSPIDEDGFRIHIADLDSNASKRDLEKVFGKFGPLREIWMARSIPCFAFVVFRYKEDAVEAVKYGDGSEIINKRIRVTHARPRTKGRGRRGFDPSMRCYQCGDRGHFSRDCPDSKYGYKRQSSPRHSRSSSGRSYDSSRRSRY